MEELNLIEKAKQGNKGALNTLFVENYPILKGYIIKMTGNPDLSQDIVQETLLKAAMNIKKFNPKAKFSTWLITIGTNVYRDMLRKNKQVIPIDDAMIAEGNSVEDEVISKIEYKEILNILQKMSYEKRSVFILKHYYSYKYEEIAEILGCPIGTVRSRLHNCIRDIIRELERRGII
ncbi:RNA polymerase sigma factor SigY [Clostridium bovifaecis]|uniref:RNA polymerase sigma factor SigY n=1 Tax=Clostridium bovifaecis TaxID=2184719 RepID=A0A6I6F063_9CLOT|nr:RNA polymerase sigma factor SigY [Clostridium bovifaecis]